tara:strand:- start:2462 stop:2890 length:429 start_codon:yes stop_codon:yes gene_type:complete
MSNKYIIHLPTVGHPYIVKNKTDKLEDLQELVAFPKKTGYIECVNKNSYIIHPGFCEDNKYWRLTNELKNKSKITTYVNEDGMGKYNLNMACINLNLRCPLFGEVFICISKKKYDKICNKLGYKLKEYNFNEDYNESDSDSD